MHHHRDGDRPTVAQVGGGVQQGDIRAEGGEGGGGLVQIGRRLGEPVQLQPGLHQADSGREFGLLRLGGRGSDDRQGDGVAASGQAGGELHGVTPDAAYGVGGEEDVVGCRHGMGLCLQGAALHPKGTVIPFPLYGV